MFRFDEIREKKATKQIQMLFPNLFFIDTEILCLQKRIIEHCQFNVNVAHQSIGRHIYEQQQQQQQKTIKIKIK